MHIVILAVIAFWTVGASPAGAQSHYAAKNSSAQTDALGFIDPEPSTGWQYGTLVVTHPTKIHLKSGDIVIAEKTRLKLYAGSASKVAVSYKGKVFTVPITFTSEVKRQRYLSQMGITPEHPVRWVGPNGTTYNPREWGGKYYNFNP